jgi:hypothetical protein
MKLSQFNTPAWDLWKILLWVNFKKFIEEFYLIFFSNDEILLNRTKMIIFLIKLITIILFLFITVFYDILRMIFAPRKILLKRMMKILWIW